MHGYITRDLAEVEDAERRAYVAALATAKPETTRGSTMSKHSRAIEVYEDNAGGLHVFALDGTATGTQVVWGASYYGMEVDAANAYADLLEGGDPVAEGWERGDLDDMDAVRRDYEEPKSSQPPTSCRQRRRASCSTSWASWPTARAVRSRGAGRSQ